MSGWSWLFFNHCSRHIDWLYKAFQKNELPNLLSNNLQNFDFINTMEKQYGVAIGDVSFLEMFSKMITNSWNTDVRVAEVITALILITQLQN